MVDLDHPRIEIGVNHDIQAKYLKAPRAARAQIGIESHPAASREASDPAIIVSSRGRVANAVTSAVLFLGSLRGSLGRARCRVERGC
jgi:hypothetical protein